MAILTLLRSALMILVGIALGALGATAYASFVTVPDARFSARQEERGIWQEAQRKAEAKAVADREAAQAEIDAIEAGYVQREAERSAQLAALEQALQEKPDEPPQTAGGVCRVLIPGRVSDQLNRTGRAAAPARPGQSDASVPASR